MSENENKVPEEKKDGSPAQSEEETTPQTKSFLFLYIAIGCFAVGCALFVLSFFIKNVGVYFIVSTMICELAAVSFINAQKRKYNSKVCLVFTILSYAVMIAAFGVFIIGTITVNTSNN